MVFSFKNLRSMGKGMGGKNKHTLEKIRYSWMWSIPTVEVFANGAQKAVQGQELVFVEH